MALRRTLSLRSLFTARCYQPSYRCIIRPDNDHHEEKPNYPSFLYQRSFSSSVLSKHLGSCSHLSLCNPFGVSMCRSMSTSHVPGSDETGNADDVAGTPMDSVMENVASQVPSDWSIHFNAFQPLIETVHSFTGLDWWASIVLTTLLIRGVTIPLMINHVRGWSRMMMLEIHSAASAEIRDKGGDPAALARRQREFDKLVKEYGGRYFLSPFLSYLQQPVLICMGKTISNMTEEVASFKTGGVLWFTDLTTVDTSFTFPLLTGLTFWITVEYEAIVAFEGLLLILRKLNRFLVIPMILWGMCLSKGMHCYLMSCMLFSIAFMHVIGRPGVKKHLRIPEVPEYMVLMLYKMLWTKVCVLITTLGGFVLVLILV